MISTLDVYSTRSTRTRTLLAAAALAALGAVSACNREPDARGDADTRHRDANVELGRAIVAGDAVRTLQLIERGADVRAPDAAGATPLINALLNERTEVALLLLAHGAEVDTVARIEPDLLAKVVPLDRGTRIAVTPLMVASIMNSRTVVKALLGRGASISATGEDDLTALHAAAVAGRPAIVRLLLERGAPLHAAAQSGETALDMALAMNQPAVAEVLELAGQGKLSQPIDVAAHYTIAARTDMTPLERLWRWGAVPVGISVGPDGTVYWSQYRTGTIERADADGTRAEPIASALDGPLGLVFDRIRHQIFYVTDRRYPRAVATVRLGENPRTLVYGTRVNRPFAITAGETTGTLYWTESINGRVRFADGEGNEVKTLFDDGITDVGERPGAVAVSAAGIAVDEASGLIFWSDLLAGTIVRARLDNASSRTILTREQGVDFPTGLAIDVAARKLYWADPGTESIVRADLDGSHVEVFADAADGVLEPYGLAVDGERRLLYWSDVARDTISRAHLDRKHVEVFVDLGASSAAASAGAADDACETATVHERREFLRRYVKSVRTCVINVAAIKAVKRHAYELRVPAPTCAREFRRARDTGALRAALVRRCRSEQVEPLIDDTLRLGAEIIAADLPRAPECLYDVLPFVARFGSSDAAAATPAIEDLLARLRRLEPSRASGRHWTLPATGQTTSYPSVTRRSSATGAASVVADDGAVRAGAALALVDNGDGTVSDPNTGLMWEKKCDACGRLHDYDTAYRWRADDGQPDVIGWLEGVNTEGGVGFAGYDDWRLPEAGELLSIVDYERFNPAVSSIFDGVGCGLDCGSPRAPACSCTRLGDYWTATEFSDQVVVIPFNLGLVSRTSKDGNAFVRAVRGPRPDRRKRFVDNEDGTITDHRTGLMWEKKCRCPGSLHNVDVRSYWSFDGAEHTVWDWLEAVNAEDGRGFAGYDDWRVPNVKELFTLMDFGRSNPSIDAAFVQENCADVTSPRCSCTALGSHWTSTTFADFPSHALSVGFGAGIVDDRIKTLPLVARAVRGPTP